MRIETNTALGTMSDIQYSAASIIIIRSVLNTVNTKMKKYMVLPQKSYQFSARNRSEERKNFNNTYLKKLCKYQLTLLYKKLI